MFFALVTSLIIPDWPCSTKWLSEEDKALATVRIHEDVGDEEAEIKTSTAFKLAAKDYLVWLCILGQVCDSLTSY